MLAMVMGTVTTVMPTRRRVMSRARRYQRRWGASAAFGATPDPDPSSDEESSVIVPLAIVSPDAEHEEQGTKADEHEHPGESGGVDPATLGLGEREAVPEAVRQRRPGDAA
jgi:hypothetical protein